MRAGPDRDKCPIVPAAQQRPLYIGRNTVRGPKIGYLDLRYSRIFPIWERVKLEFLAEGINVLNHTNVTGVNTTATVDTAGAITALPTFRATAALESRQFQLGFRLTF